MKRILVVGQTPPPYHGQAVMIAYLLQVPQVGFRLHHVRMRYSRDLDAVGRFRVFKIVHLVEVVGRVLWHRMRHGTTIFVYHPGGASPLAMIKDVVTLLTTRWFFRTTVLYFHAAGLGEAYARVPRVLRPIFRAALHGHDHGVKLSEESPPDCEALRCRQIRVIPNGIPALAPSALRTDGRSTPRILFVGSVSESKGVKVLLEAARILHARRLCFVIDVVGAFTSQEFARFCTDFVARHGLRDRVVFHGQRLGSAKAQAFAGADLFCFPTHHDAESQPLVVMEALQQGLPVVATRWRGIPSEIQDGYNGFLCPVCDSHAVAGRLSQLIEDEGLRRQMSANARRSFDERFSLERYHRDVSAFFRSLA